MYTMPFSIYNQNYGGIELKYDKEKKQIIANLYL